MIKGVQRIIVFRSKERLQTTHRGKRRIFSLVSRDNLYAHRCGWTRYARSNGAPLSIPLLQNLSRILTRRDPCRNEGGSSGNHKHKHQRRKKSASLFCG